MINPLSPFKPFNPRLLDLKPYPFEKLRQLTADIVPPDDIPHIPLSLGEPKHPPPGFVIDGLADRDSLQSLVATYPATKGSEDLREAIAAWLANRFGAHADPSCEILPVNGTREALFSFAQAVLASDARVVMPNPFYQIYEGAAVLAGCKPTFVSSFADTGYRQDFDAVPPDVWDATQLVYVCSPGNPTGVNLTAAELEQLIELAHRHDFILASDECYSEIYFDDAAPPESLLGVSARMGNERFARCVVFHSLSKRSNLPGLRSGFVAGDADILAQYLHYRTYHGCAMGAHVQAVSALAWRDEAHVRQNLDLYRAKFAAVTEILQPHYPLRQPEGGFYHWLPTPIDDRTFCRRLLQTEHVTVMPGSFLARPSDNRNPGEGHVRVAWVANMNDCITAATRLANFAQHVE